MLNAIILGIIEGLTEFLPVSSTGHLIIANRFLDNESAFSNAFSVIIQGGAILAVMLYFWSALMPKLSDKADVKTKMSLWSKVVVAVIPAAAIGIPLENTIDKYLFHPVPVAIALIVGAFLLIWSDSLKKEVTFDDIDSLTYKQAFTIGVFQCLALFPGMSRSASTIIGGLTLGLNRTLAAEFSFFLALPVLGGAALLKLIKYGMGFSMQEWGILLTGTVVSFIVAYLVIAVFMKFIKNNNFLPFAIYRVFLGIAVLLMA
jgi:undecaprenyl-diphosphatase